MSEISKRLIVAANKMAGNEHWARAFSENSDSG